MVLDTGVTTDSTAVRLVATNVTVVFSVDL